MPILTIRWVEPRDELKSSSMKAALKRLGKVVVMTEERDDTLLPADVQEQLQSASGSVFGWSGPRSPLANLTGVCFVDIEVPGWADREKIVALLVSEGCAYVMTEEEDDISRGFWWTPDSRAETEVEVDEFGNPVDPATVPDLTAMARRLRQPPWGNA